MSTEDLLDHYKHQAQVFSDHILHTSYIRDRQHGRRQRVEIRWNRSDSIGHGQFGHVWKEEHTRSDGLQDVRAVKSIDKQRMRAWNVDIKRELLALSALAKEEYRLAEVFVAFHGWFEDEKSVFLAMEYLEHGDLDRHIRDITTADEVRQITTDLLEGLKIMHSEGFTHRDLKPKNIFVADRPPRSDRWRVKIGDFGISKHVKREDTALRTQIGTAVFQAPEIQGLLSEDEEDSTYDNAVDMWSLGCLVYNLLAQRVPFPKTHQIYAYCQGRAPFPIEPISSKIDNSGIQFIQRLLAPQPSSRPSARDALDYPWISRSLSSHPWSFTFHGHLDYILAISFSPDGRYLASGSADRTVRLWDTTTGTYRTCGISNCPIESVAFSPDGRFLASAPVNETTTIFDMATGSKFPSLAVDNTSMRRLAFAPGGKHLADGGSHMVWIWNTFAGTNHSIDIHQSLGCVVDLTFSTDGRILVLTSCGILTAYNDNLRGQPSQYRPFPEEGYPVGLSPDGEFFIFKRHIGGQRFIARLDTATMMKRWEVQQNELPWWNAFAFSSSCKTLACFHKADAAIILYDTSTGELHRTVRMAEIGGLRRIAYSPDDKRIAFAFADFTIRVSDATAFLIESDFG